MDKDNDLSNITVTKESGVTQNDQFLCCFFNLYTAFSKDSVGSIML